MPVSEHGPCRHERVAIALQNRVLDLKRDLLDAMDALEQIVDPECMTRGTGGWIDTEAPVRIAQNTLDRLRGRHAG